MINEKINEMIMSARKAHNTVEAETYKMVKAKFLEFKTAKNAKPLDDAAEINIIQKMVKERKEDVDMFTKANRKDLIDSTNAEIVVLEKLLPAIPTSDDIENYITKHYPNGIEKKQMGVVIKEIKSVLIGADGNTVATIVKNHLK